MVFLVGMHNLRASEACEADVQGTQVSLKHTPVSLKSTQVSLNSSPVSLRVSICVGGCSCLACFVRASHICLTCLAGSHIVYTLPGSVVSLPLLS